MLSKLTYANVVATLALVIAIAGGGVAIAITLTRNSVKTQHIARGAVRSSDLAAGAVSRPKLRPSAVGPGQIAAGAVGSDEIANGAVRTEDIADESITLAKLANVSYGANFSEGSTAAATPSDLGTPGPVVAADVALGSLARVSVSYDVRADPGTTCAATVTSASLVSSLQMATPSGSASYTTVTTSRIGLVAPGLANFKLQYSRETGTGLCFFRNRQIWVEIVSG